MIGWLYRGTVFHQRVRPRLHGFRYRLFWLLLDLDAVEVGSALPRLLSIGRWNLLSFDPRDHGDGGPTPLRRQIEAQLTAAGLTPDGGAIRLLTLPRVFGFVFNPISVYYCLRRDGTLAAVVYEVTSTFGERRTYVLPARGDRFLQCCAKTLHVSPFIGMDLRYDFRGDAPGDVLSLRIDGSDGDGLLIATGLHARRRPLTDAQILSACLALPFATLKVVAGIHWEAFRLWLKRVPLVARPTESAHPS